MAPGEGRPSPQRSFSFERFCQLSPTFGRRLSFKLVNIYNYCINFAGSFSEYRSTQRSGSAGREAVSWTGTGGCSRRLSSLTAGGCTPSLITQLACLERGVFKNELSSCVRRGFLVKDSVLLAEGRQCGQRRCSSARLLRQVTTLHAQRQSLDSKLQPLEFMAQRHILQPKL